MKVSELTGATLDYWVARAEGFKQADGHSDPMTLQFPAGSLYDFQFGYTAPPFSSAWRYGGPIIQRENIGFRRERGLDGSEYWAAVVDQLYLHEQDIYQGGANEFGPTQLIAAMRAWVKSKFGETVHLDTQGEVTPTD
jgi:hypothetical protein